MGKESDGSEQEGSSSEAEDFDFSWMKEFAVTLLPKFNDYYEPKETKFYRDDLRNFFIDCSEEQIDDIFEYFEEENGYDTNQENDGGQDQWINVLQIIHLLTESQKEGN